MTPYGCSNNPRPPDGLTLSVQDGWKNTEILSISPFMYARIATMINIPFIQSQSCQYDKSGEDSRCSECQFKKAENEKTN